MSPPVRLLKTYVIRDLRVCGKTFLVFVDFLLVNGRKVLKLFV